MTQHNIALAIDALKDLLGDRLSTGKSIREIHGRDEAYSEPALPDAVAFPESTQEVSAIVKICARYKVPVVPFGIGTSLEGHVIPTHGGISVDTSRMNKILEIHESDLDAVVQPGVSRTQLNEELRATGLMFTGDAWRNGRNARVWNQHCALWHHARECLGARGCVARRHGDRDRIAGAEIFGRI